MAVSDLTGTKWLFNNTITQLTPANTIYSLSFVSNETEYTQIERQYDVTQYGTIHRLLYGTSQGAYIYTNNAWSNEAYRTIEITGGTDATNADLISWLEANATQIVEPTGNTYTITHTLTNLTKGNITIQITPDTDYTYPTSLTITNGTLVSYDNTTGIAVINADDTTVVRGECVEQASGYNLTISGVFEGFFVGGNLGSKVTINNTTCSVDYLGNATNIPHTFTNITTFEIEPNGDTYMPNICGCKIISGSGTYINGDYIDGHTYQAGDVIFDVAYTKIIITMTSDTVIQLCYYED